MTFTAFWEGPSTCIIPSRSDRCALRVSARRVAGRWACYPGDMTDAHLPLTILLAPVVLAFMAVALMHLLSPATARDAQSVNLALENTEAKPQVSLTPARYVGGHPSRGEPLERPWVGLYSDRCTIFDPTGKTPLMRIAWKDVEEIKALSSAQMRQAAGSVRGLHPEAIPDEDNVGRYVRIRHMDDRGWWQHTILALDPEHEDAQLDAIEDAYRQGVDRGQSA